jgi:hypothetical protein
VSIYEGVRIMLKREKERIALGVKMGDVQGGTIDL